MNDASGNVDQALLMHGVEFLGDVQSALSNERGECFHLDVQRFLSSGSHTMCLYEADDLVSDSLRTNTPGLMSDALTLCTDDVEQVQLEDHVFL